MLYIHSPKKIHNVNQKRVLKGQYWKHEEKNKRLLCNHIFRGFETFQMGLLNKNRYIQNQIPQSDFVSKYKCLSPNSSPLAPPAVYAM